MKDFKLWYVIVTHKEKKMGCTFVGQHKRGNREHKSVNKYLEKTREKNAGEDWRL